MIANPCINTDLPSIGLGSAHQSKLYCPPTHRESPNIASCRKCSPDVQSRHLPPLPSSPLSLPPILPPLPSPPSLSPLSHSLPSFAPSLPPLPSSSPSLPPSFATLKWPYLNGSNHRATHQGDCILSLVCKLTTILTVKPP